MPATNYYAAIYTAPTLEALETALDRLGNEWYESVGGDYSDVPTFGRPTLIAHRLMYAGGPEGDLVSWDTTSTDASQHRYLRRIWDHDGNRFVVYTHADVLGEEG